MRGRQLSPGVARAGIGVAGCGDISSRSFCSDGRSSSRPGCVSIRASIGCAPTFRSIARVGSGPGSGRAGEGGGSGAGSGSGTGLMVGSGTTAGWGAGSGTCTGSGTRDGCGGGV